MVTGNLSRMQFRFASTLLALAMLQVAGCRSSVEGVWHGTSSNRTVELRSGSAYITEGHSTQAVPYEVDGDKVVLKMPFLSTVLLQMPDGTLSGMGETLVQMPKDRSGWLGLYASRDGGDRLVLNAEGHAVYTHRGRSMELTYTVHENKLTLLQGEMRIPITRQPDGSLATPDAVLHKQS
jgi:hypothetical protein